jgi:hypothetical protein
MTFSQKTFTQMIFARRGDDEGRAARQVARPRFMASRCRRSSAGPGERAALASTGHRPSPLWGMGGPSEPGPERVTATGEPCARARDLSRRPALVVATPRGVH